MKKIYFFLLAFCFFTTANAQIVNIPDARFKERLLNSSYGNVVKNLSGDYFNIDANNDKQIQESEALQVSVLETSGNFISSLVGVEKFKNLQVLDCSNNQLTRLDVSNLINIKILNCGSNELTRLDLNNLINLQVLDCIDNQLTGLDVSNLKDLQSLDCAVNQLSSLNLTGLTNLEILRCSSNKLSTIIHTGLISLIVFQCTFNQFTSLNLEKSTYLEYLACNENKLTSLNLIYFKKLKILYCGNNQLTSLNFTDSKNLEILNCSKNQLTSLNVENLTELQDFDCSVNQLILLNITKLTNLQNFYCRDNQLTSLNLNNLTNLSRLACQNNKLEILSIKNGKEAFNYNSEDFPFSNNFSGNPNLKYICVDDSELVSIQNQVNSHGYTNCQVNTYCSFAFGGINYIIQGNKKLDYNKDGCDINDNVIPNLKFSISNGTTSGSIISDISGNYSIPVQAGTYTITPKFEYPTYFNVSPTTVNVTFPTQTSPFIQNFCITPNGVRPDLEVTLLPLQPARPGFDAKYKLVYKNKGNTIQSGAVNLSFTDSVLDLVVANPVASSQTANNLSWNFTNLQPFETREITFTMNVNSPMETPAVINGDILNFGTTITSSATDETPTDNTFTFNQTVVGSYDPNDKTCLEGSVITPALIGQYVHYTIRFENTGTFAAENVVVKDMIDLTKFDISTLVPTSASHSYTTRISEGNKVEFIFENINLPFDDANNDGYIAFKIKTKPTLVVNDSFSNEASIFFDYNFPIITNKAISTFKTLGTPDFDFDRYFTVYPNPAKANLNIAAKETINIQSMGVYNTLGQLVLALPIATKVSTIDVSSLSAGNYFLQIKTDKGSSSSRFVKE